MFTVKLYVSKPETMDVDTVKAGKVVESSIEDFFGGFTKYPDVEGHWIDDKGNTFVDAVDVYEVLTSDDFDVAHAKISTIREGFKAAYSQICIPFSITKSDVFFG